MKNIAVVVLASMLATGSLIACNGSSNRSTSAGEECGHTTCAEGEFCCNKSCSICAPTGGSCTQQVCGMQG